MYRVLCNGIATEYEGLNVLCSAGMTIDDVVSLLDGYDIVESDGNIYEIEEVRY